MGDRRRNARQRWSRLFRLATFTICLAGAVISIFFLLTAHEIPPPEMETAMPTPALPDTPLAALAQPPTLPPASAPIPAAEHNLERAKLEKFAELYEKNSDIIGWVRIPGTSVDYPVLQSPTWDWNFYLNRNFYREYDLHGIPYIWPQNSTEEDDITFIFGHNMHDGSRFTDVAKYIDAAFFQRHPYIEFDTLYAEGRYKIAFVFQVFVVENVNQYFYHQMRGIADKVEFPYTFVTSWESEEAFRGFIERSEKYALYKTGIEVEYGDRIIALWTCTSPTSREHRLVVVAVKR